MTASASEVRTDLVFSYSAITSGIFIPKIISILTTSRSVGFLRGSRNISLISGAHVITLLAGAARQPLFSVILSRSIYLSTYVCPQNFRCCKPPDAWRSVSANSLLPDCGCT